MSILEEQLLFQIRALGLPEPVREYRFCAERKWKSDFAYLDTDPPLLIEVDGGLYGMGRHNRPAGYANDCEKLNQAALLGYAVMRFSSGMVTGGKAVTTLEKWFEIHGGME